MSEAFGSANKPCPNCGGIVDADARFCKHCAFDLTKPGQPSRESPGAAESRPNRKVLYLVLGTGVAALIIALISIVIFKGRPAQSNAPGTTVATSTPAPAMSDKATQVEEKILRGEALTESDTHGLSAYELRVLRNTHFARYGRQYDRPGLGDYFATRSWYKPGDGYKESMLTATDKGNINLIVAIESKAGSTTANTTSTGSGSVTVDAQPTPTPLPSAAGSFQLSQEEMRQMILRRGAWDYGFGWIRVSEAEILRVGNFNEQQKYLPVRAKVSIHNRGSFVLDYQIFKNDYGDWAIRMVGSI